MKWEYLHPADRPVVDGLEKHEVVYAKDQPEYILLRCLRSNTPSGRVISRWTLTPEQRKMVAEGADVFLSLYTFGRPLQPIQLAISADPEPWFFREHLHIPGDDQGEPVRRDRDDLPPQPDRHHA